MTDAGALLFGAGAVPVWGSYAVILIAGVLPTAIWRWLGIALAGRISPDSEVLVWVRAVATSLIAAVIAKLVLYPVGALTDVPASVRIAAVIVGFAAYLFVGKRVLLGVIAAEIVLIAGQVLPLPL